MPKRKTTEQFIREAIIAHGDKYDYSKVVYHNTHTPVVISCPIHGEFNQIPCDHLHQHGCPHCARESQKNMIYGVGYNDLLYTRGTPSYLAWTSMLERCYSPKYQSCGSVYEGCSVSKDWLTFSNFKRWFDDPNNGYQEGYQLDKDILVKGNKIYSPQTCCLVPSYINTLFTNRRNCRGEYPIGVRKVHSGRFIARVCGDKRHIGTYDSIEEALYAYKNAKERRIREVAEEALSKGAITQKVYEAMIKFRVDDLD